MAFSVFDQVVQLPPRRFGGLPAGCPKVFPVHAQRPLAQRRHAVGLTQVALAETAGVCREIVRRIEAGVRVRAKTRERVLRVLRLAERGRA
jgi:predicted transcriptional regulator